MIVELSLKLKKTHAHAPEKKPTTSLPKPKQTPKPQPLNKPQTLPGYLNVNSYEDHSEMSATQHLTSGEVLARQVVKSLSEGMITLCIQ